MPGTFRVDTGSTFSNVLFMASGPRLRFGTSEQDVSKSGERKWEITCAVTFHAEHGMRPVSEVIQVGLTGGASDPAGSIPPGSPVELSGFRIGVMAPERTDKGIRGGKPFYAADGVHVAHGANGRQPAKSDAAA